MTKMVMIREDLLEYNLIELYNIYIDLQPVKLIF